MLSVNGTFQDGVAQPDVPVEGHNGQPVLITFLQEDDGSKSSFTDDSAWDTLEQLVEKCGVETGITDLAYQHDHYLYGKPKQ